MTRLEDEVRAYEESKQARLIRDELALSRSRIRREQAHYRWVELQGKVRSEVIRANKAGKVPIFQIESPSSEETAVIREDNASLEMRFTGEMFTVACEFDRCTAHNRELELIVKQVDGNDACVWADRNTRVSSTDQEIAESLIVSLLRCSK